MTYLVTVIVTILQTKLVKFESLRMLKNNTYDSAILQRYVVLICIKAYRKTKNMKRSFEQRSSLTELK